MGHQGATINPMERTREYRQGAKARGSKIGIRFSARERQVVELAAAESGKTFSAFCRDAILRSLAGSRDGGA